MSTTADTAADYDGYAEAGYSPADAAAYEAYLAAEEARGDLAFVADTADCYACGGYDGIHYTTQAVVALGHVTGGADPTQTYRLACGHTAI